jgi:uncharacterized phage protein (TIGR02220 family)
MEYIRVYLGFFENLKTKKLFRLCGYQGVTCLLRLWIYATQNKPDGILDMTNEDIELQTDWRGEPDKFVSGLIESGYLVLDENNYLLHDWIENNPHLDPLAVQKRKLRASKGGIARAKKLASKQKDCATKQSQAEIKQENCANKLINKQINKQTLSGSQDEPSLADKVIDYFNEKTGRTENGILVKGKRLITLTGKTKSQIAARIKDKYAFEDFKHVIDVCICNWSGTDFKDKIHPHTIFNNEMDKRLIWTKKETNTTSFLELTPEEEFFNSLPVWIMLKNDKRVHRETFMKDLKAADEEKRTRMLKIVGLPDYQTLEQRENVRAVDNMVKSIK